MQLFQCPRIPGKLTLSEVSCANQFRAAQTNEWRYRLPHCVECSLGAKNAGVDIGAPFQKAMLSFRCGSGKGRMVYGRLCMSCYNREREWKLGRNAKGGIPREYKPLGRFLFVAQDSCRRYLIEASCAVEARLVVQKVWGLTNLILDPRRSLWANQMTIFEEGRTAYAKTPCGGAKVDYLVAHGTTSQGHPGGGRTV